MTSSYIKNTYLEARGTEVLFEFPASGVNVVRLNGYAVVPIEVFAALLDSVGDPRADWCYDAARKAEAEEDYRGRLQ